tara:strand:- start:558 stop:863 length:306 start_codon:yes stop_codon:yes gene_type:complete
MANNEEQINDNHHIYGQVIVAYDGYENGATYSYDRMQGCWYGHTGRNANIKVHLMLGAKLTEIATKQGHYISRYPLNRPTKSVTKERSTRTKKSDTFIPLF